MYCLIWHNKLIHYHAVSTHCSCMHCLTYILYCMLTHSCTVSLHTCTISHKINATGLTNSGKSLVCSSSLFETLTDCRYHPCFGVSSAGHLELFPFCKDNNNSCYLVNAVCLDTSIEILLRSAKVGQSLSFIIINAPLTHIHCCTLSTALD